MKKLENLQKYINACEDNMSINVSANANNANPINISLTLEQALENIRKISDDILCKEEIEDKLCGISEAVKRDKGKAKDKIVAVLKFVADKGADALVAILPYLGQMAGIL